MARKRPSKLTPILIWSFVVIMLIGSFINGAVKYFYKPQTSISACEAILEEGQECVLIWVPEHKVEESHEAAGIK